MLVGGLGVGPLIGDDAGQELVEQRAPGEHVCLHRVAPLADRLRRRVAGRAHEGAEDGEVAVGHPGDAEIGELPSLVAGVKHVGRLDVAVDDPLAMGVAEGAGQLARGLVRLGKRHPLAIQPVGEGLAGQKLHDQERLLDVEPDVEDGHDGGVGDAGGGLGLALEPLEVGAAHPLPQRRGRVDGLERHGAVEQRVAGLVDDTHRPPPDRRQDLVTSDGLRGGGRLDLHPGDHAAEPRFRSPARSCRIRRGHQGDDITSRRPSSRPP